MSEAHDYEITATNVFVARNAALQITITANSVRNALAKVDDRQVSREAMEQLTTMYLDLEALLVRVTEEVRSETI